MKDTNAGLAPSLRLEIRLAWTTVRSIKLDKGDGDEQVGHFIGQEALKKIADQGPARRLSGLVLEGRRTARQGMKVRASGAERSGGSASSAPA